MYPASSAKASMSCAVSLKGEMESPCNRTLSIVDDGSEEGLKTTEPHRQLILYGGIGNQGFSYIALRDEPILPASPLEGSPSKKTKRWAQRVLTDILRLISFILSFRAPTL